MSAQIDESILEAVAILADAVSAAVGPDDLATRTIRVVLTQRTPRALTAASRAFAGLDPATKRTIAIEAYGLARQAANRPAGVRQLLENTRRRPQSNFGSGLLNAVNARDYTKP
ncbi:hypothetical protein [Zavarzinia sp. CC-PAN008]|uniref:hypothetical protein n=1 Tax=Zavarzinia sp. CC-PAN008 TaxID=3243332 RepID=UPI003F744BC2